MNPKQEIIKEIQSNISSLEHCLNDKDWASSGSKYHVEVRLNYSKKIKIYKRILKLLK